MDLVRAQLLAEIVYRVKDFTLSSFDQINPDKQERITFTYGNRYSMLRDWILNYREEQPLPSTIFCGVSSAKCCLSRGFNSSQPRRGPRRRQLDRFDSEIPSGDGAVVC